MDEKGFRPPILVGGAAAELYTQSTISTGDFDIVTARQDVFEAILLEHGFIPPKGTGHSIPGWVNPELKMGFEVVGATLLDGHTDNDRIMVFSFGEDGDIAVIPPEDLIADRRHTKEAGHITPRRRPNRPLPHDWQRLAVAD